MTNFKITTKILGATLDNPERNGVEFNFIRGGQNFGGRSYNLMFWTVEDAKVDFIKWCGYGEDS